YRMEARRPAELSYLKTRISYSELFGKKPTWDEFFDRLKAMGLRHVLASLSFLNSVLHARGWYKAQNETVSQTFDADLRDRLMRLPKWRGRIVYSPSQVLMVMKAAILHSPDREDERTTDVYGRELAEILLMANDLLDPAASPAVQDAHARPELIAALLAHSIR